MALSTVLFSLAVLLAQLPLAHSAQVSALQRLTKRGHQHSLQKRGGESFSGRATFYEAGLGACGNTNSRTDFIVALNQDQYTANKWCGKKIKISYGDKSTTATIQDECPGCPFGALDLTESLFEYFSSKDAGVFYMKWSLDDGSDQPPSPPPPPPPPPPPKKVDPPPPPKEDSPSPPPTKEDPPPPRKTDPPPAYKNDQPPQYTSPPITPIPNPFAAFQSSSNVMTGSIVGSPFVAQSKTINTSSSNTNSGTSSVVTFETTNNPYAVGGNLDVINQLVISFGSLTAASAGNALNSPI